MKACNSALAALFTASSFFSGAFAQDATPVTYTDADTGIVFDTWSVPDEKPIGNTAAAKTLGGLTFGFALPEDGLSNPADEFIGYLECASNNGVNTGWCGISLGGVMTNSLLLMAWPHEDEIYTSLRWATAYDEPTLYTGDATVTQITSTVNETHYTLIYRCQGCFSWNQDGATREVDTSAGQLLLGWAQALPSPGNAGCPDDVTVDQHDNGMNLFLGKLDDKIANPSYTEWAAQATKTVTGSACSATTTTTSAPTITPTPVPKGSTYDYVVVGGGAGGIPMAAKLSESGASVLLLEKGPPSSGRWGGTMKPGWLDGTNLTRFDVPGLCNEIWVDSADIACADTDQMAGCVLGGGTAVNAALWWKPNPVDWDYLFPEGWHSSDVSGATDRLFSKIPGTDHPSMDGKIYLQQGYDVLTSGLEAGGWKDVSPINDHPDEKNKVYGHTAYMFSNGERGGPMATYLVEADKRDNFDLWMGTGARRLVREGGHITGIEVEAFENGGYEGTIQLTPNSGRVILAAGTFGTAKVLLRSGIGPNDQLNVVKSSAKDGDSMIGEESWINLPVGYNLDDHVNTNVVVRHPDVVFYDFYEAYDDPIEADANAYLDDRTGILTQSAPNIGPLFWDEVKGSDGITRQLQWTARVEGSGGTEDETAMTISQYLGRGATSRGRMSITGHLDTVVSTLPFLRNQDDVDAVVQGIKNLQEALNTVDGLKWIAPADGTSVEDYVNDMVIASSSRRSNHWLGTAMMSTTDGRSASNNGGGVVDTNTKVYGTDNLFISDASIFPGMPTTNPSSYIAIVAEHASQLILNLPVPEPVAKWGQCGGLNYSGSNSCVDGSTCTYNNDYYWQCA